MTNGRGLSLSNMSCRFQVRDRMQVRTCQESAAALFETRGDAQKTWKDGMSDKQSQLRTQRLLSSRTIHITSTTSTFRITTTTTTNTITTILITTTTTTITSRATINVIITTPTTTTTTATTATTASITATNK